MLQAWTVDTPYVALFKDIPRLWFPPHALRVDASLLVSLDVASVPAADHYSTPLFTWSPLLFYQTIGSRLGEQSPLQVKHVSGAVYLLHIGRSHIRSLFQPRQSAGTFHWLSVYLSHTAPNTAELITTKKKVNLQPVNSLHPRQFLLEDINATLHIIQ